VAGTLRTVLREAQRLDRKVARVVIETSGVALPGQIVESLLADPVVQSLFYVATVLSVVDATQIADQLERYDEVGAQIAAADAVYVSKTDLPGTALAVLRPAIAALNPFCRVLSGDAWPLSDGWLEARNDIRAMRQGNLRDLPAGAHGRAFDSFHIPVPSGVPMARLSEFTDAVTYLLGDRILRAKGFVRVREHRRWVLVNIVRRTLYPPVFSDAALAPGESGLVFIVEDLDRDTVAEFLSLALRPEGPAQADRQEAAHV
jgi:G3E family GTPase